MSGPSTSVGAATGPWGEYDAAQKPADAIVEPGAEKPVVKRVIAGKEAGCKFFLLVHTGFVKADGELPVPLRMMDKAFKNKKKKYNPKGIATLRYEFVDGAVAAV